MFLSGKSIEKLVKKKEIIISPFDRENLKGASYTFTLDNKVRTLKQRKFLDSRKKPKIIESILDIHGYELKPGAFAIFYTKEKVSLNNAYTCILSTRATIAQMGLDVLQSSSFAEPDTDGQFALEITNRGPIPIKLYPGVKIVKGIFSRLDSDE